MNKATDPGIDAVNVSLPVLAVAMESPSNATAEVAYSSHATRAAVSGSEEKQRAEWTVVQNDTKLS